MRQAITMMTIRSDVQASYDKWVEAEEPRSGEFHVTRTRSVARMHAFSIVSMLN
jgi:hypothetical protein